METGVTFTVTLADALPPEPLHERVYDEVLLRAPVETLPDVGSPALSAPESEHEVAFEVLQLSLLA